MPEYILLLVYFSVLFTTECTGFHITSLKRLSFSLTMRFENEIGAQPPLGFWDPLGILKNADEQRFARLRYVETKHGRISMLAILGHMVTTAGWRLPGDIAPGIPFSSIKNGLAAFETIPIPVSIALFFFIGVLEVGFGI
jgi:hypothetical protein